MAAITTVDIDRIEGFKIGSNTYKWNLIDIYETGLNTFENYLDQMEIFIEQYESRLHDLEEACSYLGIQLN